MADESEWPEYLRSDTLPKGYCSWCHRKTWAEEPGDGCGISQPQGYNCPGVIVAWPDGWSQDARLP